MDETFTIRDLKVSDFEDAAELLSDKSKVIGLDRVDPILGEVAPAELKPSFVFERFSDLYKEILNGKAIAVVAESNKKVIGFCYAIGGKWPTNHVAELRSPIIFKDYVGKNIGGEMIKRIKEKSKDKFEILSLVVSAADEITLKKLESAYSNELGFVRWGLAPKFYKKDDKYYPLIFMYSFI